MVSIVLLSHSSKIVEGLKDLIGEMASEVNLYPVGGMPDGSLGSDFERIKAALEDADNVDGTMVFYDLGSSVMTAELALEELAEAVKSRIVIVDAPLVEGSLEAAISAAGGVSVKEILASLRK